MGKSVMMRKMNTLSRLIILLLTGYICLCSAQGGVLSASAREALELIARKAAKETTEEAAERTAARLLKESSNTAVSSLVKKYGDNAARLLCKPERVKLLDTLGDEAAEAMMKHGSMAERILLKNPEKETAKFLAAADTQTVRQTEILLSQYAPSAEKSSRAIRFITKHPRTVAAFSLAAGVAITAACHDDTWWGQLLLWMLTHPALAVAVLAAVLLVLVCLWWWVKYRVKQQVMRLKRKITQTRV